MRQHKCFILEIFISLSMTWATDIVNHPRTGHPFSPLHTTTSLYSNCVFSCTATATATNDAKNNYTMLFGIAGNPHGVIRAAV